MTRSTWSPELDIPQTRTTAAAPPSNDPAPFHAHDVPPYARAARPLGRLAAELHRLSTHRDDATAVRALALYEEVGAAGPAITAQTFERIYRELFERRHAYGDPARDEWLPA